MKRILCYTVLGLVLSSVMSMSKAEIFTISADELNRQLETRFPIIRQYNEVEAELYNPRVILKYLDDEIEIKLNVKVTYKGQTLEADGLIKDTAHFQWATNTLRFDRPELVEFFVSQDNMTDSTEAIKVVKQSISRSLPPIILLNFNEIDVHMLSNEPTKVSLSPQGVELEY